MKTHLRTDAFKVFAEDDEVMQQIKKQYKLGDKNWKSSAIRIALKNYAQFQTITEQFQILSDAVETNATKTDELYFLIQQRLS